MHHNRIAAFSKRFVELAACLQDGDSMPPGTNSMGFLVGEKHIALSSRDTEIYSDLFRDIYRESGWGDKYSELYVRNLLREVLGSLYLSNNETVGEALLSKLDLDHTTYHKSHVVLVPLFGITLDVVALKLGRIRIIQPDASEIARRLGRFMSIGTGEHIVRQLAGKVLAECSSVAEPIRAKEIALEETRRALEILRYAIPFISPEGYKEDRMNVSIVGDFPDAECISFIMPSDDATSITFTWDYNQPIIQVHIDEDAVTRLKKCGAMEIASLLEKPLGDLTDFDRMLLRAMHWFGNALCQGEAENELLSLTTCLETVLTPKDNSPIGTAIADGVALLLCNDLEHRKKLKRTVKNLYSKRSAVSHGGEKAVLRSELVELRDIVKRLIHKSISLRDTVTSHKKLFELIENAKLS